MAKSKFKTKIWQDILNRIANGESVRNILNVAPKKGYPKNFAAFTKDYVGANDETTKQYRLAREIGCEALLDDMRLDAETVPDEVKALDNPKKANGLVQAKRVYFDALKWYISKQAPDKYGDRKQVDVNSTVTQTTTLIDKVTKDNIDLLSERNKDKAKQVKH
jgi:hypothetical protein